MHGSPARAAYAAAVAPALPDDEIATPRRPCARAHESASVPSRSLNDQVGFCDSFFASSRGSPMLGAERLRTATSARRALPERHGAVGA